jgi:hypothetical protein
MLDREWVSFLDPGFPYDRYVFDVTFLLSRYTCIYGAGCRSTADQPSAVLGCCKLGAHYVDREDRTRTERMAEVLGPEFMQFHSDARRRGVTAHVPGGHRTRIVQGACVFLNRAGWKRGPGCALHQYALAHGEHPMTAKPEVCWLVPLRRLVSEDVADDGQTMWTTTITSYDRGAWGPGGADFGWWCTTDGPEAYVGTEPVYRSMRAELEAMTSPEVYAELAAYLDQRAIVPRRPIPLPLLR